MCSPVSLLVSMLMSLRPCFCLPAPDLPLNILIRVCTFTYGVIVRCQPTLTRAVPTLSGTFTTTNGFQWWMRSELSNLCFSPDVMIQSKKMLKTDGEPAFCLQKNNIFAEVKRSKEIIQLLIWTKYQLIACINKDSKTFQEHVSDLTSWSQFESCQKFDFCLRRMTAD